MLGVLWSDLKKMYLPFVVVNLFFVVFVSFVCSGLPEERFTIGALFHKESSDSELAFKYAAQWHNIYRGEGIFYRTNVQKVPENNIFGTSQIACDMIQNKTGLIAIFGPEALRIASITQSICRKLEIPYIQTSWQPSTDYPPPISLNFYPASDLLAQGFATILRHMNWKSYAIIYQHEEALVRLQGILKVPDVDDNPVTVRQLERDADYRGIFKELKTNGISRVILDCETEDIWGILYQAKEVGLLSYPTSYLLTSLDAHTIDYSTLNTTANITMVRLFDPQNTNLSKNIDSWEVGEKRSGRKIHVNAQSVRTEAVLMVDAMNLLIESVNQLHKTEKVDPVPMYCYGRDTWKDGYRIVAYMKEHKLSHPITGPIAFDEYGRRVNFTLQIFEFGSEKIKATWSPSNGTSLNITISARERRKQMLKSLQNTKIIVSAKTVEPYLMIREKSHSEDGGSRYKGYAVDLIESIADALNFSYTIHLTSGNKNAKFDEKSQTWSGVIGDILDGTAQLGICDLTVTHQRRQAVDFSDHFMTLGITILYRDPPPGDENIFAFLGPLDNDVWMYTATAFLGVSVLLYLTARMAPGDWENPHPCDDNPEELENIWNLGNCIWLIMGSIMTQGCDILPKGISSRMSVALWWFFSLLMTSSYTANLAAYLARGQMGPELRSVEDLIKQNKIKFGTSLNGTTYEFFRTSNYPIYQRVWDKMNSFKPSAFVSENIDGVRKVLNKNQDYAFFMESSSMEYEINRQCELRQIGGRLDSKGYGIAMPMDAPFRDEINDVILQLRESGQLQTLKNKWWKELNTAGPCKKSEEDEEDLPDSASLTLENVGGVFVVLGVGVAISFLISVVEFLWEVRDVAIQKHVSYWEALMIELKFAVNILVTKKAARPEMKEPSKSREASEARSIAEKVLQSASSLLNGESILDRISVRRSE